MTGALKSTRSLNVTEALRERLLQGEFDPGTRLQETWLAERMQVVGVAGMQPLEGTDFEGDFELGWWIWKDFWGQGLALEAITPFVTHARNMGLERVVAVIDPPNSASIRVAEKLGMHFERTVSARETVATREDKPACIYAMELARG